MAAHPLGELPAPSAELVYWLAMVTDAAHRLRGAGRGDRAVRLLRRAADRTPTPHVRAGMHALADLFAAYPLVPAR